MIIIVAICRGVQFLTTPRDRARLDEVSWKIMMSVPEAPRMAPAAGRAVRRATSSIGTLRRLAAAIGAPRAAFFLATALLVATAAHAHHSGAMFDRSKTVTLHGTVKEFQFTNPHVWILLLVPDESGNVVEWDVEASAPARLVKWGISAATVHAGDKITLNMHPLKDGRKGGSLVDITLANGTHATTDTDVNAVSSKN
jgi:hypothetical protein